MGHDLEIARISGFPVFREVHEFHCVAFYPAVPYLILESVRASVEVVAGVVDREFIFLSVEGEVALGDSVGISSRAFAEAWAVSEV